MLSKDNPRKPPFFHLKNMVQQKTFLCDAAKLRNYLYLLRPFSNFIANLFSERGMITRPYLPFRVSIERKDRGLAQTQRHGLDLLKLEAHRHLCVERVVTLVLAQGE